MNITIKTPEQRLRVYVSSTFQELSQERKAIKDAILSLNLIPVMFEQGARPYAPKDLYTAYMQQSHVFIGVFWEEYSWNSDHNEAFTLEDEFNLSTDMPRLIYLKSPAPNRTPELNQLIDKVRESGVSYRSFQSPSELVELVINDLSILLTERFELSLEVHQNSIESDKLNENFPIPSVPIIGRDRAIKEVFDLIQDPFVKLITVSGPGGIGKTRLALEIIRKVKQAGFLKVCFVPLGAINGDSNIADVILRSAFPMANAATSSKELLYQLIGDKKVLLLLDNFEHLVSSRLLISDLIKNCSNLKILITSRELLHLSGEYEYALSPLSLGDKNVDSEHIPPSMELFIQRAKSIHAGFAPAKETLEAIREICQLLDGIPLAIELAAARTRLLTPQQLLALLQKSLDVLRSDNFDTPARHQTLKSTVDWSFKLLNVEEQKLLCMLSVFSGGGTLEAANAMSGSSEKYERTGPFPRKGFYSAVDEYEPNDDEYSEIDFLESIESLLSKSLVHTTVNKYGELRINFYQTIQYYCQGKLIELGLKDKADRRHLYYYLHFAEQAWPKLKSEHANETYELLDNDILNIEKAMQYSLLTEPVLGLRIAVAMAEYWDTRGKYNATSSWIERFLSALPDLSKEELLLSFIARLELARALFRLTKYDKAWDVLESCHREASLHDEQYILADTLIIKNLINVYSHRNENKEELLEEALDLTRSLQYEMALLDSIQHKAADRVFTGQVEEGIPLALESLQLARKLKAKRWEAIAHIFLGFGYFMSGSHCESANHFKNTLVCTSSLSDQLLPVYALLGLSQITLVKKDLRMTGLLLGVVDSFIHKPGTQLVPIVSQIHLSILDNVRQLEVPSFHSFMEEGRSTRIGDMISVVLEKEILLEVSDTMQAR